MEFDIPSYTPLPMRRARVAHVEFYEASYGEGRIRGNRVEMFNVPADTKIVYCWSDWPRASYGFVLSHPSFDPVLHHEAAPPHWDRETPGTGVWLEMPAADRCPHCERIIG